MSEWFERLSPRERKLLVLLGAFFVCVVAVGLPLLLEWYASSKRAEVSELRAAISAVQEARGKIWVQKTKKESVQARYANKAPALAGFLEERARAQKLEIMQSQDRTPVPQGKFHQERTTQVVLKKAGMYPLAKFLEAVEQSGYPVTMSKLHLKKRPGEADSYDFEVAVSAWDRQEPPKPAPGATP